jgi:hypothetical protein
LNDYFVEAVEAAQAKPDGGRIHLIRFDNIADLGNADQDINLLVNAANTTVTFGGGISGAIGAATKDVDNINAEAQGYIDEFNRRIKAEEEEIADEDINLNDLRTEVLDKIKGVITEDLGVDYNDGGD